MTFMEERRQEYLKSSWTRDVWEEELTVYKDKEHPSPEDVRKSFANVKLTRLNYKCIAPILTELGREIRYDFKEYMHQNWMKK